MIGKLAKLLLDSLFFIVIETDKKQILSIRFLVGIITVYYMMGHMSERMGYYWYDFYRNCLDKEEDEYL